MAAARPNYEFYKLLKQWKIATEDKTTEATHRGIEPTLGKWCVPAEDNDDFLSQLAKVKGHYCITERLSEDAVSNLAFDVDVNISKGSSDLQKSIIKFCSILQQELSEHTDVYNEDRATPSVMCVLQKPEATQKFDKSGFPTYHKAGFKVMLPYDLADVNTNRLLADRLRERIGDWLDATLEVTNAPEDIVDDSIYTNCELTILGSRKSDQAAPYSITQMLSGAALEPVPVPKEGQQKLLSRLVPVDGAQDVLVANLPDARTAGKKRKDREEQLRPAPKDASLVALQMVLQRVDNTMADNTTSWISVGKTLKEGIRSNDDEWNTSLCNIWHNFSAVSSKYSEAKTDERWAGFDVQTNTKFDEKLVCMVCKHRADLDLEFDRGLVTAIFRQYIKKDFKDVVEGKQELYKKAYPTMATSKNPDLTEEEQSELDEWRLELHQVIKGQQRVNSIQTALLRYMSVFFVFATCSTKTEIVELLYENRKGVYTMDGWIRTALPQWKQHYNGIGDIVATWLDWDYTPRACGYDLDPTFVHMKGDERLQGAGRPQFNTFCGFNIDRQISPEDARTFKYDQSIVDRVREHTRFLMNHNEDLVDYVERWQAWPLQNRGKRTEVMIINRSDKKGVGKGLYWNEFFGGQIYGMKRRNKKHSYSAFGQIKDIDHVVGQFPEGLIGRVFLNLDECGIFDGATKQNEKLKSLVTEGLCSVNQKHLSLMEFFNCLNMVLTSNKTNPIKIEPGDRRFLE
eukprot:2621-Heterococcus_DN1.PRE.1